LSDHTYRLVTFDLETRKGPQDVGGWEQLKQGKGGISLLIAHDSTTNEYSFFDDHTLEPFAAFVAEDPDTVLVGYNSKEFDLSIVQYLLGRRFPVRFHVDIFDLIKDALTREGRPRERGWKLGDAGLRAMGITKPPLGAHAPQLAEEGRYAELITYCRNDVDITRALMDYVRRHGGLADHDGSLLELDLPKWLRFRMQEIPA